MRQQGKKAATGDAEKRRDHPSESGVAEPSNTQDQTQEGATETVPSSSLQREFDALAERKTMLWQQIRDQQLYRETEQWREIEGIDEKLVSLAAQMKRGN